MDELFNGFASLNNPNINDVAISASLPVDGSSEPGNGEDLQKAMSEIFGVDEQHSASQFLSTHPDASPEDVMKYMSQHSDVWAEKLIDYYTQKQSIEDANKWTASREDTAYQRLVQDMRKAGLNPALLYGSSASTSSSGSAGTINLGSNSTSQGISNMSKIKQLLIASVLAQWQITHQTTQDTLQGLNLISKLLVPIIGMFS